MKKHEAVQGLVLAADPSALVLVRDLDRGPVLCHVVGHAREVARIVAVAPSLAAVVAALLAPDLVQRARDLDRVRAADLYLGPDRDRVHVLDQDPALGPGLDRSQQARDRVLAREAARVHRLPEEGPAVALVVVPEVNNGREVDQNKPNRKGKLATNSFSFYLNMTCIIH